MPSPIIESLFSVLAGAFQTLVLGIPYASKQARAKERQLAEAQFMSKRVTRDSGEPVFDGGNAQVLSTEESFVTHNGRVQDYVLTIFSVTPENRYFLFKSNPSGKPYFNELTPERARLVLKGKFREYRHGDA